MENFTPGAALLGGALIGLSAAILILFSGRIAGVSSILGGLLNLGGHGETRWRLAFVAGLIGAPALVDAVGGGVAPLTLDASIGIMIVGGLLVGLGTRLGGGCTSGHGVCGMSRLSPRSIAATLIFMLAGFVTVFVVRHALAGAAS